MKTFLNAQSQFRFIQVVSASLISEHIYNRTTSTLSHKYCTPITANDPSNMRNLRAHTINPMKYNTIKTNALNSKQFQIYLMIIRMIRSNKTKQTHNNICHCSQYVLKDVPGQVCNCLYFRLHKPFHNLCRNKPPVDIQYFKH